MEIVKNVNPTRPDGAMLRRLYWEKQFSDVEIARHYGVTPTSVARWRKRFRIPARSAVEADRLAWQRGLFGGRKNGMLDPRNVRRMSRIQKRRFKENPNLGRQHSQRLLASQKFKDSRSRQIASLKQFYADHPERRRDIGKNSRDLYEREPWRRKRMSDIKRHQLKTDPDIRKRISSARQGIALHQWERFLEPINAQIRKMKCVREAHQKALLRDDYCCKKRMPDGEFCGSRKQVEANDIVPFRTAVTPALRIRTEHGDFAWAEKSLIADPNNLITLCRRHHQETIWREHEFRAEFAEYIASARGKPLALPQGSDYRQSGYKLNVTRDEIVAMSSGGKSLHQIALVAGVSKQRIWQILNGR